MPSFFNINEVQFIENNYKGPLSGDVINKYGPSNSYRYPMELGQLQYNHYINFQIYVRDKINPDFGVQTENGDPVAYMINDTLVRNRGNNIDVESIKRRIKSGIGGEAAKKVAEALGLDASALDSGMDEPDNLVTSITGGRDGTTPSFTTAGTGGRDGQHFKLVEDATRSIKSDAIKIFRTLKRAKESIALYMPDTLNFDYEHQYQNMGKSDMKLVKAAQYALSGAQSLSGGTAKNLSPFITEVLDNKFKTGGVLQGGFGYAINPQFEVFYQSTKLREFNFDFLFTPRSEREAESVYKIIEAFKFHAAPEVVSGTAGRFLLAPSAFDIGFYYNGSTNPNIPKISTCVCTRVMADYAPSGFAAYETRNSTASVGGTGTPVVTRLQLTFSEITLITKELIRGQVLSDVNGESPFQSGSSGGSF